MAHLHLGKVHVPGGIIIWLCGNSATNTAGPTGTPICEQPSGTVTRTITANTVQAIPLQNVTAGDFNAVLDALESNTAYGNVHTVNFPAAGICPQVTPRQKEGD